MHLSEAQGILSDARAWYKGRGKSSNKTYAALSLEEIEIADNFAKAAGMQSEAARRTLRNTDAFNTGQKLPHLRKTYMGYAAYGAFLHEHNITYGNCAEMASLAIHFVKQRFPTTKVYLTHLSEPADHAFVSVNAAPQGGRISTVGANGAIFIDVWMNICCEAQDYMGLARKKLDAWASTGKLITYRGNDVVPNSGLYTSAFFHSKIVARGTGGMGFPSEPPPVPAKDT